MNGPTFAATTTAPATRPAQKPAGPMRPAAKPEAHNPAFLVLAYLRLHWLTILFAGALLGTGLAYVAWLLVPAKYESYAIFRVAQNPNVVAGTGDPNRGRAEFTTFVKTNAALIKTEFVYRAALRNEKLRIADTPTLKAQRDPIKWLDDNLNVTTKEGSELITVSLKGDSAEDVRVIVDAMVKAFEDEVINKEKNEWSAYRVQLQESKSTIAEKLKGVQSGGADAVALVANAPGKGLKPDVVQADGKEPLPVPGGGVVQTGGAVEPLPEKDELRRLRVPMLNNAIFAIENKSLAELELNTSRAKLELDAIKSAIQKVLDEPIPDELKKAIEEGDLDYKKAEAKAKLLNAEFAQKSATVKNPSALASLQQEVERAEIEANRVLEAKLQQAIKLGRKARIDKLTEEQDRVGRLLFVYDGDRKQLRKQLDDMKAELRSIPSLPEVAKVEKPKEKMTADDLNAGKLGEIYTTLVSQLAVAELNVNTPTRISKYQPASVPQQKEPYKQYATAGLAGLFGFIAVAAVLVGLEFLARRVSSLGELRSTTPVPVIGVVPWMPDEATARDPGKRADVNEAIDKLRAYIAQSWMARGATTITVTSALGSEGKAFAAFGLASSLAQSGSKTLLVDFDLRDPALHPYAGSTNAAGVCELLRGESDFRRTIQILPSGLHFLCAGRWSGEARQAAVGGRLDALLTRLKEPFDCVVLHGHALLTVAESVEVVRRSDAVLLCALYRETRTPMLKKALDRIASMDIPHCGVAYLGATANEALC